MPSNTWLAEPMAPTDRGLTIVHRASVGSEVVYITRRTSPGEVVTVTDVSGGSSDSYRSTSVALAGWVLTVTRGREGTTAVDHAVGAVVDWNPPFPDGWEMDTWETPE